MTKCSIRISQIIEHVQNGIVQFLFVEHVQIRKMNSHEVKWKNAELRRLQTQKDDFIISEEEKEAFEQLKASQIEEAHQILENLDQINESNALQSVEAIRSAYNIDPLSFIEFFSNEEIIAKFLQLLQIQEAQIPILTLLTITCYHTEDMYEIYAKNNIFEFLKSFLESLFDSLFDSAFVKDVIRHCLRYASTIIDLFRWMDDNVCNMNDMRLYNEEEQDEEQETQQDENDQITKTTGIQSTKFANSTVDEEKDLGDVLFQSHFLDVLKHFCDPSITFLNDECARILYSLTDYSQLYPQMVPLLIPLAFVKTSALGDVLESLSKIIDNGCEEAIEFVFQADNSQFFDFLHEIIGEMSLFAPSAIKLIMSISSFNDDSIKRVGDLGFLQQFFEMIPEVKENHNDILEAIIDFFENLTRTADSQEFCDQIISLFSDFNFYDFCQSIDSSMKSKMIRMLIAFIRITTNKEFVMNHLTEEMVDLICDVITTDNNQYIFQIIITLRKVLEEFSNEEEFTEMIENVLGQNDINLDDHPF